MRKKVLLWIVRLWNWMFWVCVFAIGVHLILWLFDHKIWHIRACLGYLTLGLAFEVAKLTMWRYTIWRDNLRRKS